MKKAVNSHPPQNRPCDKSLAKVSKKNKGITKHHLTPVTRCKEDGHWKNRVNHKSNILRFEKRKHRYWHYIFGVYTLEEIILLLARLHRAKNRCQRPCAICALTIQLKKWKGGKS